MVRRSFTVLVGPAFIYTLSLSDRDQQLTLNRYLLRNLYLLRDLLLFVRSAVAFVLRTAM
jgi:hypothetical protein